MTKKFNRREVLATATAAVAISAMTTSARAQNTPAILSHYRPLVVASANGNILKNEKGETGIESAYRMILANEDVLDATLSCVHIPELSEDDASVGYGGLPDANGNVTLDSCVMHGPKKMAGGVAYLQGVRMASLVAKDVMNKTYHHLLSGQGAQDFARKHGHTIEDDLNSNHSRKLYEEWKERIEKEGDNRKFINLDIDFIEQRGFEIAMAMANEGKIDIDHIHGTINCTGMNTKGDICGVTTTSGRSFKVPGRIGDSPILGAGLYLDNAIGAAGSTGLGEANLYNLCSFLVVEKLREGMHPKDAGMYALNRVIEQSKGHDRFFNEKGEIAFNLNFYILDKKGRTAGVTMRGSEKSVYSVHTENGPEHIIMDYIYAK